MKSQRSILDNLKPSPEALAQLTRLHATIVEREAKGHLSDPVEFVLVEPVPRPEWGPAPVIQ